MPYLVQAPSRFHATATKFTSTITPQMLQSAVAALNKRAQQKCLENVSMTGPLAIRTAMEIRLRNHGDNGRRHGVVHRRVSGCFFNHFWGIKILGRLDGCLFIP